jgi:hypothetical protein
VRRGVKSVVTKKRRRRKKGRGRKTNKGRAAKPAGEVPGPQRPPTGLESPVGGQSLSAIVLDSPTPPPSQPTQPRRFVRPRLGGVPCTPPPQQPGPAAAPAAVPKRPQAPPSRDFRLLYKLYGRKLVRSSRAEEEWKGVEEGDGGQEVGPEKGMHVPRRPQPLVATQWDLAKKVQERLRAIRSGGGWAPRVGGPFPPSRREQGRSLHPGSGGAAH